MLRALLLIGLALAGDLGSVDDPDAPTVGVSIDKPEAQPERPPRSAWVEDQRVIRALKWGGIGLGGAIVLLTVTLLIRRAWRRRRATAGIVAAVNVPRRAPDAVAIEKLTALRAAGN